MVVKNGFDVLVEKGTSGVLIVNIPHLPFWKAYSNGIELPVVPANEIHMAVNIPNSAQFISIRYGRPLLRETVLNFLNNTWHKIWLTLSTGTPLNTISSNSGITEASLQYSKYEQIYEKLSA